MKISTQNGLAFELVPSDNPQLAEIDSLLAKL